MPSISSLQHSKIIVYKDNQEYTVKCPLCKSENISDESLYHSNDVLGPKHAGHITELLVCNECGIYFKNIETNSVIKSNKPEIGDIYE